MAPRVQCPDNPPPRQFVARRALLAAAMLLLATGCQPDPGEAAAAHVRTASGLEAGGATGSGPANTGCA